LSKPRQDRFRISGRARPGYNRPVFLSSVSFLILESFSTSPLRPSGFGVLTRDFFKREGGSGIGESLGAEVLIKEVWSSLCLDGV